MAPVKYTVREFKIGWAVFRGDEVITRTDTQKQAADYLERLQNPDKET